MAYVTIPNSDVDQGSPVTVALMTALRDNLEAVVDGDASAPILGLTILSKTTITGSPATIEFTGFVDATRYVDYVFRFSGVSTNINDKLIYARTSSDGGSTWDATVGDYNDGGSNIMVMSHALGNASGESANGMVTLCSPNLSDKTQVISDLATSSATSGRARVNNVSHRDELAAVNGIQFLVTFVGQVFTGGEITVYGVGISV